MNAMIFPGLIFRKRTLARRFAGAILALTLALASTPLAYSQQEAQPASNRATPIPATEFSRMVQEFSEPEGDFDSDNFTSNETSYLHVVGKLKELGITGGAYLGVAPEQNFTYIAKIRPRIAFIVDIRRQAMIQHLFYKAIFHRAKNRAEFLSLLFSKPLPDPAETGDSLEGLLNYIRKTPAGREAFLANLAAIRKTIEENFRFPLSSQDAQSLEYVCTAFWRGSLSIGTRGFSYGRWRFPTLGDLIVATDLNGKRGNFLAQEEDYQFVRNLQEQNRVIPVVGDFAGAKAFTAVANYLRKNGYTVSAFYTSNVEQYLYGNEVFGRFAENVAKLPISDRSVFIRAVRGGGGLHPASVPGYRMITLLQKISVFLEDYPEGLYPDYWRLVTTHYIAGVEPRKEVSPSAAP